jgi:hypothetical protein
MYVHYIYILELRSGALRAPQGLGFIGRIGSQQCLREVVVQTRKQYANDKTTRLFGFQQTDGRDGNTEPWGPQASIEFQVGATQNHPWVQVDSRMDFSSRLTPDRNSNFEEMPGP